jgi:hypothetical protein
VLLATIVGVLGDMVQVRSPVGAMVTALWTGVAILAVASMHWLVNLQLFLRGEQLTANLQHKTRFLYLFSLNLCRFIRFSV